MHTRFLSRGSACIAILLLAAGCGSGTDLDPAQSELQGLVDRALDVTDLVCPVVEESGPFLARARDPIYKVNPGGTISVTKAGLTEAAMMALGAVETGMCFPELQKAVDARMPYEQVAEARAAADAEYERLAASRARYSKEAAALLDRYAEILESVDEMTELAQNPGKNPSFYLLYAVTRDLYMSRLEAYCAAVDQRKSDSVASSRYEASRERYLQAAADYLVSPVRDLTRGEGES